ncbi:MAG: endonuclease Q family protein [Lachnospiraceae bacterium]|nr:endonuclease Q family protein [Lachnospiraceae bacterium]
MLIPCGKCGKRYDYEKYNGICPKCGRYNRRDSAVLERELHERYDADPAHSEESHKQVHKKNYDSYRHQTGDRRKPDGNFWGSEENYTKKHLVVVLAVMIVIVMFFVFGGMAVFLTIAKTTMEF